MWQCILEVTKRIGMKLEPFQLETIRACVSSRAVRLLKQDLFKYVPSMLETMGLIDNIESREQKEMYKSFLYYCKRFIAVVAPRRNGKSKAGKLFVAANAACEDGAIIVLLAHQISAVLLYKDDILNYLQVILNSGLCHFRIRNGLHYIKLEFDDVKRKPSFIYFVAGGQNVSITVFFPYFYCIQFFLCRTFLNCYSRFAIQF